MARAGRALPLRSAARLCDSPPMKARPCTVVIENVIPLVDGGRYPIQRTVGESVEVSADIFKDGHDVMGAVLKWRKVGAKRWQIGRAHV